MNSPLACVAVLLLASLQVALSAPAVLQDFSSYFEMPHHLRNFGDSKFNQLKQRSRFTKLSDGTDFKVRNWNQQQRNTNNLNGRASFQPRAGFVKQTRMSPQMMMSDAATFRHQPVQIMSRQGPPVVSVPPMLPPLPDITEQQLYGSVDIDALTAPYSLGENTREDQTPVQLPDTNEVRNGVVSEYDHAYPDSNKVQDVTSNHEIHTYTNQTNNIAINNLDLHRHHKIVNATTNYITNVSRFNQPAVLNSITNNNATEHQPYLYIVQSQNNLVNDNQTAVELPTLESTQENTVLGTPTFDAPIVQKYNYDGQLIPVAPVGRR